MTNSSNFPYLESAPIKEAIIDIQVRSEKQISTDSLTALADNIKEEFPQSEKKKSATVTLNVEKNDESSIGHHFLGYIMRSEDKHYAIQILRDRLAYSCLTPYQGWGDLELRTKQNWDLFREYCKPDRVSRLAVRYINRLLIPLPIKDFALHFSKPIEIPDGIPQGVSGYAIRTVVPDPEIEAVANINQLFEGVVEENGEDVASIIFDIDVFKNVDLDVYDDQETWDTLQALRDYKNRIFFSSLTQSAIERYL